ncbi:MAG: tRNA (guanosine(37)-N1)-methyltransferase TrmD [Patescibacteria group bacterium]|nr:tRNA (guanosine(37)-N1)-methyltransferase TrmD [Patescibacteria group bacterium]MDE2116541.1 tRNA (guanosine(37)-N1)-methyltransferase TrmD [Patescibacteria group bacterium]
MTFHIVTLFPGAFDSYLGESILKRAIEDKKIRVKFYNPRDFADDKWQRVDQKPYGGGPGMVIQALPVAKAIEKAQRSIAAKGKRGKSRTKIIFFSPAGKQFDTAYAKSAAKKYDHIILVSGRYEGIDARVKKMFKMEDVSVGPYVLTGGELPAMIMMDSIARQIEGVLGNFDSREEERVASPDVYTRPEAVSWKGKKLRVPKVLLSGNHADIDAWRNAQKKTRIV